MNEEIKQQLLTSAFEALENAYAPYSNFQVGAAILCQDGKIFKGANIENCSYGATNCAERTALFACYSAGYRMSDIVSMAIVTKAKTLAYSCGICRQVMSELLSPDMPIIISNGKQEIITYMRDLLPNSFNKGDLA